MSAPALYPLLFTPVLKDYIWGGRNLERLYGRKLPAGVIAESWEIAAHRDGTTRVINGRFAGQLLTQVHAELGLDLIGSNSEWAQKRNKFPLLIKLLDANQKLSVQVHPDDQYAQRHEGNELGKTEMWVVLHAQPDAALIMGVTAETTAEAFYQGLLSGEVERHLHRLPIKRGDTICVPSGSIHAILGGSVIAEIQQNSNTTYRVFDWNRRPQGSARPLHIRQAMDVINFDQVEPGLGQPELLENAFGRTRHLLCRNEYFVTERVEMNGGVHFAGRCDGQTMEIWGCLDGRVRINGEALAAIQFALLPAKMGDFMVEALENSSLLRTYVGPKE